MNYLMVLPVEFYLVDKNTIACESAFALHLKILMPEVKKWSDKLVIYAPSMSKEYYENNKDYLSFIDSNKEDIFFIPAQPYSWPRFKYFLTWPFCVIPKIYKEVSNASVIHSGPSQDLFRPFEILAIIIGAFKKRNTIFFIDIDQRTSADMLYKTGKFSLKSYLLKKYIYNNFLHLQIKFAVKYCSLLLLKGQAMVDDYGKGLPHVKNFYDTAHDLSFVLNNEALESKILKTTQNKDHIRLVYFGRLVEYKGIKHMFLAVKKIKALLNKTDKKVTLSLIGSGEQEKELREFAETHNIEDNVIFKGAMEYGSDFFAELENYDMLLATPLSQDTPRSAFDAFSVGLPIVAYDTYYYKDLEKTGAVQTVPWLSTDKLASAIVDLKNDTQRLQTMCEKGVIFARENTQDHWLKKRFTWYSEFLRKIKRR
jgi:glycosyltransferase involved in cell wall biosynthesis